MSDVPAEIIGDRTAEQICDDWSPSDDPEFREFLDHVTELIAHDYVRRMRETADPEDLKAWETATEGST